MSHFDVACLFLLTFVGETTKILRCHAKQINQFVLVSVVHKRLDQALDEPSSLLMVSDGCVSGYSTEKQSENHNGCSFLSLAPIPVSNDHILPGRPGLLQFGIGILERDGISLRTSGPLQPRPFHGPLLLFVCLFLLFNLDASAISGVSSTSLDDEELGFSPQSWAIVVVEHFKNFFGDYHSSIGSVDMTIPAMTQYSQDHHVSLVMVWVTGKVLKECHEISVAQVAVNFHFEGELLEQFLEIHDVKLQRIKFVMGLLNSITF